MLALVLPGDGKAQVINSVTALTDVTINDPSFGDMKAFTVKIPSGWQFQGTVTAALGCNLPSPVFRAYSRDGLTEIRLLPSFNWQVKSGNKSGSVGLGVPPECIYLDGTMTAEQFMDRYVQTLGPAHVVGPMSISAQYRQQLDDVVDKMKANKSQDPKWADHPTGDATALRIETTNGTFTIEQRLRARVVCNLWSKAIAGNAGNCSARLDVLRAPKGQLDALVNLVDSQNLTTAKNDDLWLNEVIAEIRGDLKNHFDPYVPNRAALVMLYRQAHDFRLIEAENRRAIAEPLRPVLRPQTSMMAMFRPSNGISDWADFALDPKPFKDPDGTMHVATTIRRWDSSSGQRYQTDNPGANPNGVFPGRWISNSSSGSSSQP